MSHIFVFGSNLAGRHGKGAALTARKHYGAVYGVGEGPTGHCYAIPTKDGKLNPLSLSRIQANVANFVEYAKGHPGDKFFVTRIGCGLAGWSDHQIAPMFLNAPMNCYFDTLWEMYLPEHKHHLHRDILR